MVNSTEYTTRQVEVIKRIKKHFGKKNPVSRAELVAYMQEHEKQAYAPGFIVKNEAFKAKDKEGKELRGMYALPALDTLKVSATAKAKATPKKKAKKAVKGAIVGTGEGAPVVAKTKRVSKPKVQTEESKNRASLLEAAAADFEETLPEMQEVAEAATN